MKENEQMEDTRKETYQEKIEHLKKLSGWEYSDCEEFVLLVYNYLVSCGYFIHDYNIHNLPSQDDVIKYNDRDFGRWLLDMALQYNMEQGKEYQCKLIEDRNKEMEWHDDDWNEGSWDD